MRTKESPSTFFLLTIVFLPFNSLLQSYYYFVYLCDAEVRNSILIVQRQNDFFLSCWRVLPTPKWKLLWLSQRICSPQLVIGLPDQGTQVSSIEKVLLMHPTPLTLPIKIIKLKLYYYHSPKQMRKKRIRFVECILYQFS